MKGAKWLTLLVAVVAIAAALVTRVDPASPQLQAVLQHPLVASVLESLQTWRVVPPSEAAAGCACGVRERGAPRVSRGGRGAAMGEMGARGGMQQAQQQVCPPRAGSARRRHWRWSPTAVLHAFPAAHLLLLLLLLRLLPRLPPPPRRT